MTRGKRNVVGPVVALPAVLGLGFGCVPNSATNFAVERAFHTRRSFAKRPSDTAPAHAVPHPTPSDPPSLDLTPPAGQSGRALDPGAVGVSGHVPSAPPLAFEWDFEGAIGPISGVGWQVRSGAREFSTTCGRIDPSRLPHGRDLSSRIGGDYWEGTYWPGQSGKCFVDTAGERIILVSPPILLDGSSSHVSFLVGGGREGGSVTLEVEGAGAAFVESGPGTLGMVRRDHALDAKFLGHRARLVVQGLGGHGILVDDVVGSAVDVGWSQPGPVWGMVDLHNHVFNHLTFGGRLISGRVTEHPLTWDLNAGLRTADGMEHALGDCERHHGWLGPHDAFSLSPEFIHRRDGFPTFDGWPKATTTIHEQVYVDWLKRAWMGGLRIVQLDVGNSAFSAQIFSDASVGIGHDVVTASDADAVERTLDAVREFVDGEGRGWTEIASTSEDARRIVGKGELALVLGVEVEALGDYFTRCPSDDRLFSQLQRRPCHELPTDTVAAAEAIDRLVEHLYARGVTHVIPIHMVENAFGYPASYGRAFDVNSEWANGKGFDLANGWDRNIRFRLDDDNVDGDAILTWAMSILGDVRPQFDRSRLKGNLLAREEPIGHTSLHGLKAAGRQLIDALMRRGMLIDVQHMSEATTDETIAMAEAANYPLETTHTGFRELSFGYSATTQWSQDRVPEVVEQYDTAQVERIASDALKSGQQLDRLRALGGMVGVGLTTTNVARTWGRSTRDFCDDTTVTWASSYEYALEKMQGRGIAFGSDANGLATLPKPRFGTDACLGANGDDYRAPLMHEMADRQHNGVRYEAEPARMGVTDAGVGRFSDAGQGYAYSEEERAVWQGLALAEVAYDQPTRDAAFDFIDTYDLRTEGRPPRENGIVRRYAKGFWVKQHRVSPELLDRCEDDCDDMDNCKMVCLGPDTFERAAYLEYPPREAGEPSFVGGVVARWLDMSGLNKPIHKYTVQGEVGGRLIERDFDFNLEGMAHYGLLPDWAQDASNVGLKGRLGPLFLGAEDFIEMWEKAERRAAALSGHHEAARPRGP